MNKDSDLTPFSPKSPKIQKISATLRQLGNIGFWLQTFLGVISTVLLLIAGSAIVSGREKTPGIELGIFCAFCGVILLGLGVIFSFRYIQIAKKIQTANLAKRPTKAGTLKLMRYGLIINLVGMLVSILGAEALSGIVLLKTLSLPQVTLGADPDRFVNSVDLLIVQANTNTIAAHFAGIVTSLVLLDRITK